MYGQRGAGFGEVGQFFAGRHIARPNGGAGQDDGLADAGQSEFTAKRGGCRGKSRYAGDDLVGNREGVEAAHLFADCAIK